MKASEFKKLIREEVKKVLLEADQAPIGYTKEDNEPIYAGQWKHVDGFFEPEEKPGPNDYLMVEKAKNTALRVTKDNSKFPDGKYGVIIHTWGGAKRFLVYKDSKTNTHKSYSVDKRTYDKATNTNSGTTGNQNYNYGRGGL